MPKHYCCSSNRGYFTVSCKRKETGDLEPKKDFPNHELCLLFIITANSEENSKKIAKSFGHFALHFSIPEWQRLISGLAFPFSPSELYKGEVYYFNLNHTVKLSSPLEMFRTEFQEIK